MKAQMLLISAFIIALFTFAACSDDQEQTYSCNPQADTWVKKKSYKGEKHEPKRLEKD